MITNLYHYNNFEVIDKETIKVCYTYGGEDMEFKGFFEVKVMPKGE